jgi:hypothetical protein
LAWDILAIPGELFLLLFTLYMRLTHHIRFCSCSSVHFLWWLWHYLYMTCESPPWHHLYLNAGQTSPSAGLSCYWQSSLIQVWCLIIW